MTPVRYGVVGLGQVSTKGHIPSILQIPEAEIVAVADVNSDALDAMKRQIDGVRTYATHTELLADRDVEVALIATPNWLHVEQAVAAFDAGKHVFCEKPLGVDLDECNTILAAQARSGKLLQVGHEMRYAHLMRSLYEKVQEGLIGNVQMITFQEFRFPLLPGWRQTGKTGGVMLEKNSHFFDMFNWLAGDEPVRVLGCGGNNVNKDSPLIDHCIVTVEYANQVRATLVMCLFAEHGSEATLDVVGETGRLIAQVVSQRLEYYSRKEPEPQEWRFEPGADGTFHMGFRTQHEAFVRSVRDGAPVLMDGPQARKAMRVALAAERAVAGETVVGL